MPSTRQLRLYRCCTPVVDAQYDGDGEETILGVLVEALAEAEGIEATDLPPLYGTVDLDALAQLFENHDGRDATERVFSFTFDHWNVFVHADGRIRVCDSSRFTDPVPVFESSTD